MDKLNLSQHHFQTTPNALLVTLVKEVLNYIVALFVAFNWILGTGEQWILKLEKSDGQVMCSAGR